jgi:predicted metal-dependent peptidase
MTDNSQKQYSDADISLRLNAARVIASEKQPYLSTAIFAMAAVKIEGLGTFASDAKWRLYFDPNNLMEWPVDQVAGVILHEVGHCIRGHATRFETLGEPAGNAKIFNIAGDSLINVDLRDEHISLPEGAVYIDTLQEQGVNVDREMSAEQIYQLIKEKAEENCTCDSNGSSEQQDNESSDSSQSDGESSTDNNDSGEGSNKQSQDSPQNDSGDSSSQGSQPCPVHRPSWDCGSAADGIPRDYEQEGEKVDEGVDAERGDLIRQQVAVEINQHAKNRGNVPAGLQRWAKELLDPTVDWRKELASIVRRSFAQVAGLRDYTYQRPSRRDSSMRAQGQGIVLPAMRQPNPPKVSIVIDTSGSMSDDELTYALSETQGVLRSLGSSGRNIQVITCDAQARATKVNSISKVNLEGGGGTDMRVGINEAMNNGTKPDVVIVLTDGFTPWPDEPLKGATLIAGLTDKSSSSQVPSWARTVLIGQGAD